MRRSSKWLRVAMPMMVLHACAQADSGDTAPADVMTTLDARADAGGTDVGDLVLVDVRDTPTDTGIVDNAPPPRDVHITDSGGPTDTGAACTPSCTTNAECTSSCPPPLAGYHYCCQTGPGGGSCAQQTMTCPPTTGGGGPGSPCTANTDCTMAPSNCCAPSVHICGCMTPFGCSPVCP